MKILVGTAITLAATTTSIAVVSLLHVLMKSNPPDMLIHELEAWVIRVGLNLALILLAASGIYYLAYKKK